MVHMSSGQVEATIRFKPLANLDVVYRVFKAMEPEFRFRRGSVTVKTEGGHLTLIIKASDVSSARSLMNSVLKHVYLLLNLQHYT